MFKNSFKNSTQSSLYSSLHSDNNNLFLGNSNILGTKRNNYNIENNDTSNLNDEIMFAVVTSNIIYLKKFVNSFNVNNIIDKKNNYTALHHAVRIKKNDQVIEYLMNCGANPYIKQNENKDAIDMSIDFFEHIKKKVINLTKK